MWTEAFCVDAVGADAQPNSETKPETKPEVGQQPHRCMGGGNCDARVRPFDISARARNLSSSQRTSSPLPRAHPPTITHKHRRSHFAGSPVLEKMNKASTSLMVFRSYIVHLSDGTLDCSGVVSRDCYLAWLECKVAVETDAEAHKYHRTLTNHVSGVDGRSPFDVEEEEAILVLFRQRLPWPCFPEHLSLIGTRYRAKGYHEKQRMGKQSKQLVTNTVGGQYLAARPTTPSVPVKITPSMMFTAAQQLQRELPQSTVQSILWRLSPTDRGYVHNLSQSVVNNFSSPNYSLEDWQAINQIFRFVVLAKTNKCALDVVGGGITQAAKRLCEQFSLTPTTIAMVFDMTASLFERRCLIQNEYSLNVIGNVINNPYARCVDGSELFSVVLAIGAAFVQPGYSYCVANQKHWCADNQTRGFDMCYFVDPASLLLVAWGKLSNL
ncbi:hypothetical protein BASA81_006731 [Batrachochytrium salamandrivorans]|nr:hypothetical protein BASA81_006731 [Batrachochytrium salamandrivorans]